MKTYEEVLKAKIDYYGRTEAAYQFAAEEFSNMNVTEQLRLHSVVHRRELLLAAICEYNKFNTQKDIKSVDDWLENWDSK